MQKIILLIIIVAIAGLVAFCSIAGPAFPEQNGRDYLEKHGYSNSLITKVVNSQPLDSVKVKELSQCKSIDVRYLVARNPFLSHKQIDTFINDEHFFVRSGAACNTNLSPNQVSKLTDDPSHTVYCQLAENPSLTEQELLLIREKRDPGILWFAMNPNCPDSIRTLIIDSDDDLAKDWLETVDRWKQEGYYIQDERGRWFKPLPVIE